ncbi:MAG: ATP-dependent Clp protease ATP-binding subunit, partial [Candidatus Magasanikbacteria bacterium]
MNESSLLDNLSNHLKNVIAKAIALATGLDHEHVEPVHIFLALTEEKGSMACEILQKHGIEEKKLLDALTEAVRIPAKKKKEKNATATLPQLSDLSKQAMEKAMVLAYQESHNYVGTEHILYGLLQIEDEHINNVLQLLNVKKKDILKNVKTAIQSISNFPNMDEMPEMVEQIQKTGQNVSPKHTDDMLKKYTIELTDAETQKNIDPVIGREKEIERMIHILSRRNKNNPILLGEPGVGKTAIVEGLAKKISEGDVPDILKNKHILNLDLTHLISGTIYRGEFEDRLKQVIDEVSKNPNTILFIDEIHNIIGAGSNQGTMDAANILKPALARGKIRCIGATTLDEYTKYISGDPALERRFQAIQVFEPTKEETKQILLGIKKYYENYHKTNITEEAIETAVDLSTKYIHDNFLPDKAIDLIDEACALVRTKTKISIEEKKYNELTEQQNQLEKDMEEMVLQEKFEETEKLQKKIDKIKKEQEELSK